MPSIAIVEDNPIDQKNIMAMLDRYSKENSVVFNTQTFDSGESFVESYAGGFDIIFLDVEMPGIDGIETARKIRQADSDVTIIFVTNMAQYAIKGYEVDALDFVIKPVEYPLFSMKLKKTLSLLGMRDMKTIALKSGAGVMKLKLEDILYAEVRNHKLIVHTLRGQTECPGSLTLLEEKLDSGTFSKCNNGNLVNLKNVRRISGDTVTLANGENLSISRPKKKDFQSDYARFLGGSFK